MEEELSDQLREVCRDASQYLVEDIRDEYVSIASEASQGADGLVEHVGGVEYENGKFVFEIDHPTAPLHEKGGHIEPSYTKAKLVGYSRDDFYQSLEDCNEWVKRKKILQRAVTEVKSGSRRVRNELR